MTTSDDIIVSLAIASVLSAARLAEKRHSGFSAVDLGYDSSASSDECDAGDEEERHSSAGYMGNEVSLAAEVQTDRRNSKISTDNKHAVVFVLAANIKGEHVSGSRRIRKKAISPPTFMMSNFHFDVALLSDATRSILEGCGGLFSSPPPRASARSHSDRTETPPISELAAAWLAFKFLFSITPQCTVGLVVSSFLKLGGTDAQEKRAEHAVELGEENDNSNAFADAEGEEKGTRNVRGEAAHVMVGVYVATHVAKDTEDAHCVSSSVCVGRSRLSEGSSEPFADADHHEILVERVKVEEERLLSWLGYDLSFLWDS